MEARHEEFAETGGNEGADRHLFVPDPWAAADIEVDHHENWLISYIDILTLFLTLFAVLLVIQPKAEGPLDQEKAPLPEAVAAIAKKPLPPKARPSTSADEKPPQGAAQTPPAAIAGNMAQQAGPESTPPSPPQPKAEPPAPADDKVASAPKPQRPTPSQEKAEAPGVAEEDPVAQAETPPAEAPPEPAAPSAAERMLERLNAEGLGERLHATRVSKGVRLELRDNILFGPASADLTDEGRKVLDELARVFKGHKGVIAVEGHTDNVPISTPQYPSNWELSSGRATRVARYLIGKGLSPDQLKAVGYADTRPIAPNDTAEGRARNRRVTLVVQFEQEDSEGQKKEAVPQSGSGAPSPLPPAKIRQI